jgi:hypothetical protein
MENTCDSAELDLSSRMCCELRADALEQQKLVMHERNCTHEYQQMHAYKYSNTEKQTNTDRVTESVRGRKREKMINKQINK